MTNPITPTRTSKQAPAGAGDIAPALTIEGPLLAFENVPSA